MFLIFSLIILACVLSGMAVEFALWLRGSAR